MRRSQRAAGEGFRRLNGAASGPLAASLGEALDALAADERLVAAFGAQVADWYTRIKRFELARHAAAEDKDDWQAREYFGRIWREPAAGEASVVAGD